MLLSVNLWTVTCSLWHLYFQHNSEKPTIGTGMNNAGFGLSAWACFQTRKSIPVKYNLKKLRIKD